jgi:hypothetical protein
MAEPERLDSDAVDSAPAELVVSSRATEDLSSLLRLLELGQGCVDDDDSDAPGGEQLLDLGGLVPPSDPSGLDPEAAGAWAGPFEDPLRGLDALPASQFLFPVIGRVPAYAAPGQGLDGRGAASRGRAEEEEEQQGKLGGATGPAAVLAPSSLRPRSALFAATGPGSRTEAETGPGPGPDAGAVAGTGAGAGPGAGTGPGTDSGDGMHASDSDDDVAVDGAALDASLAF